MENGPQGRALKFQSGPSIFRHRVGLGLTSSLLTDRGPEGRGIPWPTREHPGVSGRASVSGRVQNCAERPAVS